MHDTNFRRAPSRPVVEALESRLHLDINDYVLAFASGLNLVDIVSPEEHGGIYIMKPNGTGLRQITQFKTSNFQFSGHGLNLPDDHPSFSPDGKKIVFTSSRHDTSGILREDNFEIYTMDVNGANVKRLTFNNVLDTNPAWSPDGTKIAFASRVDGGDFDIWVMDTNGNNRVRLTDFGNDSEVEPAWSPDGSKIAFSLVTFSGVLGVLGAQKDIWVMNADGSNKRQLTDQINEDHDASWNPAGTQLAITSERGRLVPTPPSGDTVIIRATDGVEIANPTAGFAFSGGDPAWSPDGSKLAIFKFQGPLLASPIILTTLNPDGSGRQDFNPPGIISVHPAWGLAADSDNDGRLDYLENDNLSFNQSALPGSFQSGALLGAATALADLDHDGFEDLIVGVPSEDIGGDVNAGRIVLLRGSTEGPDFSNFFVTPIPASINAGLFGQRQANGRFGQALVSGDFNGDGFRDLVVAAPGQNRIFTSLGASLSVQQLTASGGDFGIAMAVGDFNHDGKDDLAVGSPGEQRAVTTGGTSTGSVAAGAVRVYFGASGGLISTPQIIDQGSLPATDAGGKEHGDRFGAALAAGDLNGDGFDDLIVGVPGEDIAGVADAGIIHAIPGRAGFLNVAAAIARDGRNLPSPHTGLQANARFGESLIAGDFNGDVFDIHDLVVGIASQDVGGVPDAGLVALFAGGITTSGTVSLPTTATAFTTQQVGGPSPTSVRFGQTLIAADFTGDAVEDLAVAAPHQGFAGQARAGVVYLIPGVKNTSSGSTQFPQVNINPLFGQGGGLGLSLAQQITPFSVRAGAAVDDHFGASLLFPSASALAAGDIDKDGQSDLVIGTPERNIGSFTNSGQVSIRYGIKVGTSLVTPADTTLPRGKRITYRLEWTHPDRWRDLSNIQLRIVNDDGVLGWIRFDEATGTLALMDPQTGQFDKRGFPGQKFRLKAGKVELLLRHSRIEGTGDEGASVTLTLALKLKVRSPRGSAAANPYRVEVFASDDNGNSQGFEQAATLRLRGAGARVSGGMRSIQAASHRILDRVIELIETKENQPLGPSPAA